MLQVHLQIEEQIGDDMGHLEEEAHHQMAMKIPVVAAAAAVAAVEEGLETPAADAPARIEVLAAATVAEIEQLLVVAAVVAVAVVVAHSAALGRCDEPQVQEEISLMEEEKLRQLHLHH